MTQNTTETLKVSISLDTEKFTVKPNKEQTKEIQNRIAQWSAIIRDKMCDLFLTSQNEEVSEYMNNIQSEVSSINDTKTVCVYTAQVARYLLKLQQGYTIVDIKPDKFNPERTIFVFKNENNIKEIINTYLHSEKSKTLIKSNKT